MDFSYSPEDERFRQELRAWLTDNKPARAERVPHDDASLAAEVAFLRDWQRSLHAAGYLGLLWPREYGGRGARPTEQAILNQELARARAPQLPKHRGLTYFILDMESPGITIRPLRQLTGSTEFSEVFLDAVRVPRVHVVGVVNQGWEIALTTLAHERGTGFAFKEQVLQRIAVEDLVRLARERGRAADPVVRQEIARGWIEVELMRLMNCRTLTRLERGEEPGPESSLVKLFWASLTQRLHQLALELEGPYATLVAGSRRAVEDGRWQQAFLWSRVGAIAGGTSEVQANIIAQRILGLPR